jgi:hypothetical protein
MKRLFKFFTHFLRILFGGFFLAPIAFALFYFRESKLQTVDFSQTIDNKSN